MNMNVQRREISQGGPQGRKEGKEVESLVMKNSVLQKLKRK